MYRHGLVPSRLVLGASQAFPETNKTFQEQLSGLKRLSNLKTWFHNCELNKGLVQLFKNLPLSENLMLGLGQVVSTYCEEQMRKIGGLMLNDTDDKHTSDRTRDVAFKRKPTRQMLGFNDNDKRQS